MKLVEIGNPLATADARSLEARAIGIFATPRAQEGKAAARQEWRRLVGDEMTAEAERSFDDFVEEFAFCCVLKAVNSDGDHPKVMTPLFAPPHEWMGLRVPGSRGGGGDSPDNSYSFMPIDHGPRYEITGRRRQPAPADTPFTLTGDDSFTTSLSHLDGDEVQTDADGGFRITLDPAPAAGRANHLQTRPGARYVFARESRSDWRQVAAGLTIRRVDPPTAPPLGDDEIVLRATRLMKEGVAPIHGILGHWRSLQPNTIAAPKRTADFGGFVSQQITMARLALRDDEAFVARIGHGGAAFRNFVAHDFWLRSVDYWNITSSMNNSQGAPDADGCSTTYVVSRQDPGVHNWIDPGGLQEINLIHRWQGLPRAPAVGEAPAASGRLTKIRDLDSVLPKGMRRVTPAERAAQLAQRRATFQLRFFDRVTIQAP